MAPKRRRDKKKYRPVINDVFRFIAWNQNNRTRKKPEGFEYEECSRNFANATALATHVDYRHPHQLQTNKLNRSDQVNIVTIFQLMTYYS